MCRIDRLKSCEDWGVLISCGLDGELTAQEHLRLADHLRQCPACRSTQTRWNQVHQLLRRQVDLPNHRGRRSASEKVVNETACQPFPRPHLQRPAATAAPRFGVNVSIAATAVVALLLLSLVPLIRRTGETRNTVAPLVVLTRINSERIEDQKVLRDSLELDLRTLKLQVATLDSGEAATGFLNRIDRLMKRIDEFESMEVAN